MDSGEILVAQRPGVVDYVDGQTIIILNDDGEYDEYLIPKFQRCLLYTSDAADE